MAMRDYSLLTTRNIRKRDDGGVQVPYSHQLLCINGEILKYENPYEFEARETTYYVFGADNNVDYHDFECSGDEVLVESSPPASPAQMAARLATPAQGGGNCSPNTSVRELIVIPELPNTIHLQHAIQQVSNVVEVNGDSSGHSSPNTDGQHTYITVAMKGENWKHAIGQHRVVKVEVATDDESEGNAYHVQSVQYVDGSTQELYTDGHQPQMETLRTYPLYNITAINPPPVETAAQEATWSEGNEEFSGFVGGCDDAESVGMQQATKMSPATVQWLQNNYERADGVSMPRSTVYAHYIRYCSTHNLDPVNAASFGKLIRSVFIGLRTRRLGTRGNSKYHYNGIRAKADAQDTPPLNEVGDEKSDSPPAQEEANEDPDEPEGPTMSPAHRQYLGPLTTPDPPPLDVPHGLVDLKLAEALLSHHRRYGTELLKAVASLDNSAVERARRKFCRRPPRELPRKQLCQMMRIKEVSKWLSKADLQLHQKAVELLLPEVLRPQPPQLTQAIRNFAKGLESSLSECSGGSNADASAALAAALRRYTSLNHLAQAARAVLNNKHQINQMLADLNRVDFRVVREQAVWACSCISADTLAKFEDDFKSILSRGSSLEQWAVWLEGCVEQSLTPHHGAADYGARARRLLLDWSFYCSLVIRELTLRSAASFGSFHLIRLLYDEYVAYLVERRVAEHEGLPPIAVMYLAQKESEQRLNGSANVDAAANEHEQFADTDGEGEGEDPDWEWGEDDEGEPERKRRNEE